MKKARMNISHSRFILSKLKIFGEIVTTKQKSSKANPRVHYFMLKRLQKAMYRYLDFSDLGQVTKFNPKMQDFKRILDLT